MASKKFSLSLRHNDHCKRLADPHDPAIYHLEALVPFTEAVKLDQGNANVRPAAAKSRPVKEMFLTLEEDPRSFHLRNRGMTYFCDRFSFDNAKKVLEVEVPDIPPSTGPFEDEGPKCGIADGGHTFFVIKTAVARLADYQESPDWVEPFVRIHFVAGNRTELASDADIVEALNTSTQVRASTLEEYQGEFDELKLALQRSGFDLDLIGFRENELKDWDVEEILQRMACFLRERWEVTQPVQIYKSKRKALDLYVNSDTRADFQKLYDVIRDVVTFPEFIQSELSSGNLVARRSVGKLRLAKPLKKAHTRPGTSYVTNHKLHLAATLPMAAAFRELLSLKGDRYFWLVDPYKAFRACAEHLYQVLKEHLTKNRSVSSLGADSEYWSRCVPIVMRYKSTELEKLLGKRG